MSDSRGKVLKIVLISIAIVAVLLIVGAVVLYSNLDKVVQTATEKTLSYVLLADVKVGGCTVKPTEGLVEFRDIVIGNPKDKTYGTDRAMRFGIVKAKANIKSFRTDEPVINLVQLSQAEITMEARLGGSNLQDLMDNASRLAPKEEAGAEKPAEQPAAEEKSQKAIKIEKVVVEGTKVRVAIPFQKGGKTLDVALPSIEMNDLGGKKQGVTPAEAMREFFAGLIGGIKKSGSGILPDDVLGDMGAALNKLPGGLRDAGKSATEGVGGAVKGAGKAVEGAVQDVGLGLINLIGGVKKKKK